MSYTGTLLTKLEEELEKVKNESKIKELKLELEIAKLRLSVANKDSELINTKNENIRLNNILQLFRDKP